MHFYKCLTCFYFNGPNVFSYSHDPQLCPILSRKMMFQVKCCDNWCHVQRNGLFVVSSRILLLDITCPGSPLDAGVLDFSSDCWMILVFSDSGLGGPGSFECGVVVVGY